MATRSAIRLDAAIRLHANDHTCLTMPYQFTCPHCQTKTLVDDQYSGHVGRCVTCDQPIKIPNFAPNQVAPDHTEYGGKKSISPTMRRLSAAIVCIAALAGLAGVAFRYGVPALTNLSNGRERAIAVSNLQKIASALNAYAADHGVYPLPIVRDTNGNAMHSWRVTILPYLNELPLFNAYDFNQPWDASENYSLLESMPAVYASPNPGNGSSYECFYQLVTGERTLFPRTGPLSPQKLLDDPSKTGLVVEALPPKSRQNLTSVWMEPTELDIQGMSGLIGSKPGIEIGAITEGGVAIATVDGRGHFLEETTSPEIVLAILTASGGEPLADDVLD